VRYDVRDLLGHWVAPKARASGMCPHACCRNRRVHPDNFPVIMPKGLLHRATDRELWNHVSKYGHSRPEAGEVGEQVIGELTRREEKQTRAALTRQRRAHHRATKDMEFRAHEENQWLAAEKQTSGVMLNRAGKAAGIDERSLFTGPESRVRKYASPELLNYFETNPRVSRAEFMGGAGEQRRGGRRRAEGGLLGTSRAPSVTGARPRAPRRNDSPPARGGDVLRKRRYPAGTAPAGTTPKRPDRRPWATRISPDNKGWVVVRQGVIQPGTYDSPRAAQGAMRKAANAAASSARLYGVY
jgi:hypothetical protein